MKKELHLEFRVRIIKKFNRSMAVMRFIYNVTRPIRDFFHMIGEEVH